MENQSSYREVQSLRSLLQFLGCANGSFVIAFALCLLLILNYLVTLWELGIALRSKKKGKEPPTLPYLVPILSHVIPFAYDTRGTISTITYGFTPSTPARHNQPIAPC